MNVSCTRIGHPQPIKTIRYFPKVSTGYSINIIIVIDINYHTNAQVMQRFLGL